MSIYLRLLGKDQHAFKSRKKPSFSKIVKILLPKYFHNDNRKYLGTNISKNCNHGNCEVTTKIVCYSSSNF